MSAAVCNWCLAHGRKSPSDPHVYCVSCGGCSAPHDTDAAWNAGARCRYLDCIQGNPVASDEERVTCSECRHNLGLPQIGWQCGWSRRDEEDCDCTHEARRVSALGRDILQDACDEEPPDCECDSTHDDNATVCRWCYAHGRRLPADPPVSCDMCGGASWNHGTVPCKFCGRQVPARTAHLHQQSWVGECCWDERLRVTE